MKSLIKKLALKYNVAEDPWRSKVTRQWQTFNNCTVLGNNGKDASKRKWFVYCSECAKDSEMFGDGVFSVGVRAVDSKTVCPCNYKGFRYTEDQYRILVKRHTKVEGYNFLGWNGYYSGSSTKLRLTCSNGHGWETTSVTKLLVSKRGCPHCAGNVPISVLGFINNAKTIHPRLDYSKTISVVKEVNGKNSFTVICPAHGEFITDHVHHIHRKQGCPHIGCVGKKISDNKAHTTENFIEKATSVHGEAYDYSNTVYDRSFSPVEIKCNTCFAYFAQTASDHLSGCGCPTCAGNNQKQLYLFGVYDKTVIVACKFGIANNYIIRLKKQNRESVFEVIPLLVYEFDKVEDCKTAERSLKRRIPSVYLSREEYQDGYTETIATKFIGSAKDIIVDSGGLLIEEYKSEQEEKKDS